MKIEYWKSMAEIPPRQCTVPKIIDFPRYNTKCSWEKEILRGIFGVAFRFPLHFVLYLGNVDYFLDSVCVWLPGMVWYGGWMVVGILGELYRLCVATLPSPPGIHQPSRGIKMSCSNPILHTKNVYPDF